MSCLAQNIMRIGQTKSFPLPEQHWIHLLIFFMTLITGAVTDEDVMRALLGGSASFNFKVTADMKVTLLVWEKCPDQKVFVYSPSHGLTVSDKNYEGRLFISNHSIILDKIQESDFVTYCYKLTTFPNGSLQGKYKLEKKASANGDVLIMIISVSCSIGLIVLCVIITGVVCFKKRKSNAALDLRGTPGSQLSVRLKNKKQTKRIHSQNKEEVEKDDFNYLNIN